MVYGTTLRLPGELFVSTPSNTVSDPLSYVDTLKELMNQLQYRQPRSPSNNPIFVHKDLADCTHVFIRNDAKKLPFQPTYNGPFKVVERKTRHFVITYNDGRTDTVSIDHLKPAYSMASSDIPIDPSSSNQSPSPVSQSHPTTIITSPAILDDRFSSLITLVIQFLHDFVVSFLSLTGGDSLTGGGSYVAITIPVVLFVHFNSYYQIT